MLWQTNHTNLPQHMAAKKDEPGLRVLHPALYRAVMTYTVGAVALGINFCVFTPTFLIFGMPNLFWCALLLAIGTSQIVFLNFYKVLKRVRLTLALGLALYFILAVGTGQPFLDGVGSLQLPIMYLTLAALQLPLLLEAGVNPRTKK